MFVARSDIGPGSHRLPCRRFRDCPRRGAERRRQMRAEVRRWRSPGYRVLQRSIRQRLLHCLDQEPGEIRLRAGSNSETARCAPGRAKMRGPAALSGPSPMPDHHAPPPRVPAQVAPAETPGLNSLLTLCVCVVVVAALYLAREVLIPITVAILLSFLLAPLADLLRRCRVPHVPAVLLAVVLGIGTLLTICGRHRGSGRKSHGRCSAICGNHRKEGGDGPGRNLRPLVES